MVDEKDIKYENISEFYEDTDAIHLKFQINHVQMEITVCVFFM